MLGAWKKDYFSFQKIIASYYSVPEDAEKQLY
jgi:hypothetical protein